MGLVTYVCMYTCVWVRCTETLTLYVGSQRHHYEMRRHVLPDGAVITATVTVMLSMKQAYVQVTVTVT